MNSAALMEARGLRPMDAAGANALDLALHPGEIVCLLGRDEDLRSSWLAALGAVEPPAAGELALEGRDAWHLSRTEWRLACQRFGFIGERTALVSTLDGLANVMLPALYHGRGTAEEIEARALELIERFGLGEDCRRLPAFLRPGQRRRLLLARCLLLDPLALFVDEPFRLGDGSSWQAVTRRAVWLNRGLGLGLVVSTRNLRFVREHGSRIVVVGQHGASLFERFDDLAGAAGANADVHALLEDGETGTGR